ncbi:MAG: hypothetical protein KME60_21470 [Cyanomargarita calcarea GSE-NOS-MK-12-04C]|jgi:hypothetical protein|uniref:Glucose-inhibited division protein A n=1 Tax=Cyanomargarita calcarea GSE-NOS-MK-12-04C TaxID=2839659 RepID=A0A951QRL6_9CYAN|nr:hypothetical protein [Cyanomargarita calcarea GSE-NOS-MK-12-04C]
MDISKFVAIVTGAISIIIAIAYLILVQFLDFRGEMKPAPISQIQQPSLIIVAYAYPVNGGEHPIFANTIKSK